MRFTCFLLLGLMTMPVWAKNTTITSFQQAKEVALNQIYTDHRTTLYCGAIFDADKNLTLPEGFKTEKYEKRVHQLEWEHVVPVESLGKTFDEWKNGSIQCYTRSGKPYKGRKCAEKYGGADFKEMQADLYNIYPSIGSVNAMRSNREFAELPKVKNTFGSCAMKIKGQLVEPPDAAKGIVARTYLYMDHEYHLYYQMTEKQKVLMTLWDEKFPPDEWECLRAHRIQQIQGNSNQFVAGKCG